MNDQDIRDTFVKGIAKLRFTDEYLAGLQQAYKVHADVIGKSVDELTIAEKKQAWLNELIERYGDE